MTLILHVFELVALLGLSFVLGLECSRNAIKTLRKLNRLQHNTILEAKKVLNSPYFRDYERAVKKQIKKRGVQDGNAGKCH